MGTAFENYLHGDDKIVKTVEVDDASIVQVGMVNYQTQAREFIFAYIQERLGAKDPIRDTFTVADVYVVWFAKVLQNWKALLGTTLGDRAYYEVTHNGDEGETYIDEYKKFNNVCVPDSEVA